MNNHTDTLVYIEAGAYRGPFPSFHNVLRLGWEAGLRGGEGCIWGHTGTGEGEGGAFVTNERTSVEM